jgi:hypothetical protein
MGRRIELRSQLIGRKIVVRRFESVVFRPVQMMKSPIEAPPLSIRPAEAVF